MIPLIQKILQAALILGILYVIYNPAILPERVRPLGYGVQRWSFGNEVTLESAKATWQARWTWLTTYVPPLADASKKYLSAPAPITPESVLTWFNVIFWQQPQAKLELIKNNYEAVPLAPLVESTATPSSTVVN
jgi:hypothetical protein